MCNYGMIVNINNTILRIFILVTKGRSHLWSYWYILFSFIPKSRIMEGTVLWYKSIVENIIQIIWKVCQIMNLTCLLLYLFSSEFAATPFKIWWCFVVLYVSIVFCIHNEIYNIQGEKILLKCISYLLPNTKIVTQMSRNFHTTKLFV